MTDSSMANPTITPITSTHDQVPQWAWRSVVAAVTITGAIFLIIPYLETLSQAPRDMATIRSIETTTLPSPPPPPPPPPINEPQPITKPPKPKLTLPEQALTPLQAAMDLSMALGHLGGDFAVNFSISDTSLSEQVQQLIFEISDLDDPPRPLTRLKPLYPPQARMRRIEGFVALEFLVDPAGQVRNVQVIDAQPGDLFTASAIQAIERWRFSPGTRGGEPVTTRVRQKVEFKLN